VSSKSRTDWRILGCAAAAGVAVALPAGIVVGRYGLDSEPSASERDAAIVAGKRTRDVYSPSFRNDPYVIEQQRRIVESLEQACRETRQNCKEAEEARRSVEEAAAGR
jgi:hypothetical protein